MNELTGYVKRAVATNTFFYPRPERDDYPEPMILG